MENITIIITVMEIGSISNIIGMRKTVFTGIKRRFDQAYFNLHSQLQSLPSKADV